MRQKAEAGGHNLGRILRWVVAILVSGAAAWLAIRQIHWGGLRALLAHVRLPLVALGLGTVLATTAVKAARWQLLLRQSGVRVGGWRAFRALVVGQMGNSLLPARLGDIARAALVASRVYDGAPTAFGTVIAEKLLDGATGMVVVFGIAAAAQLPGWFHRPVVAMAMAIAALLALTAVALSWPRGLAPAVKARLRRAPLWPRIEARISVPRWKWLQEWVSRFGRGLAVLAAPTALFGGLGLSIVIWGLGATTNYVMLKAAGAHVPLWANLLVLVAVYAATFLPAVPAQIGVFEYACVLALGTAGAPADAALAFGLLLHLVVYAPPALLGPAFAALEGLRWHSLGSDRDTTWRG
jgi:uncharacterized protein (TIRG00374 family)